MCVCVYASVCVYVCASCMYVCVFISMYFYTGVSNQCEWAYNYIYISMYTLHTKFEIEFYNNCCYSIVLYEFLYTTPHIVYEFFLFLCIIYVSKMNFLCQFLVVLFLFFHPNSTHWNHFGEYFIQIVLLFFFTVIFSCFSWINLDLFKY